MTRIALAAAAIVLGCTGGAEAQTGEWRAFIELLSGDFAKCPSGGVGVVRIASGRFAFFSPDGKNEQWSLKLAADGSGKAEAYSTFTKSTLKVDIPAGTEPRAFQVENVTRGCQYKVSPTA